jgi:hypothetical protein
MARLNTCVCGRLCFCGLVSVRYTAAATLVLRDFMLMESPDDDLEADRYGVLVIEHQATLHAIEIHMFS